MTLGGNLQNLDNALYIFFQYSILLTCHIQEFMLEDDQTQTELN